MMKQGCIAVALMLATFVNMGVRAAPPSKTQSTFRGMTGLAEWFAFDGCKFSNVVVIGTQNTSHSPGGGPASTTEVNVIFFFADICVGTFLNGSGSGPGIVSGNLQRLSIQATVPLNNTPTESVAVNVTLTRTDDYTLRNEDHSSSSFPTAIVQMRSNGTKVSASASGSVVLNGIDFVAGLTSDSQTSISDNNSGSLTIIRQ